MPTNVTPAYKKAEEEFREARDSKERLVALRAMLRTIPKHKGTEHLQAGIKTKIKELTEELAAPRKGRTRGGPVYTTRPEGAGQIALLGPPNSGKSSLHDALTGSGASTGPYPFTTQHPQPGMVAVEDIGIQLIDLPPLASEYPLPWIGNALQPADGALLVIDLSLADCVTAVDEVIRLLAERRVYLTGKWPRGLAPPSDLDDPFAKLLPTVLVAAQAELIEDVEEEAAVLLELLDLELPVLEASVVDQQYAHIGPWLFDALGVVRVYTESAAQKRDDRPYTIRRGQTLADVAAQIHKDFVRDLKYARLIRPGYPDRRIGRSFPLQDGDRIEIHI